MNEDEVELSILQAFVTHFETLKGRALTEGITPTKCDFELDISEVLRRSTGETSERLVILADRWLGQLAGSSGAISKPLRLCSDSRVNQVSHRYHARAYSNGDDWPAWERIRELKRSRRGGAVSQNEFVEVRKQRQDVLKAIYDGTGATLNNFVPSEPLGEALGLDATATDRVIRYLLESGWVVWGGMGHIGITKQGIDAVEGGWLEPSVPGTVFSFGDINISGGIIGALNLGQVFGELEVSVSVLHEMGQQQLADAIKALVEKIPTAQSLTGAERKEALELVAELSAEAGKDTAKRKTSNIRAFAQYLGAGLTRTSELASLWQVVESILKEQGML